MVTREVSSKSSCWSLSDVQYSERIIRFSINTTKFSESRRNIRTNKHFGYPQFTSITFPLPMDPNTLSIVDSKQIEAYLVMHISLIVTLTSSVNINVTFLLSRPERLHKRPISLYTRIFINKMYLFIIPGWRTTLNHLSLTLNIATMIGICQTRIKMMDSFLLSPSSYANRGQSTGDGANKGKISCYHASKEISMWCYLTIFDLWHITLIQIVDHYVQSCCSLEASWWRWWIASNLNIIRRRRNVQNAAII